VSILRMSRGSTVGIAIGYGLDDRGIGIRVPVGSTNLTNTLIRTTVRNKICFVLDFIVHYYNMFRPRSGAILR
jgi:hypothetical protein